MLRVLRQAFCALDLDELVTHSVDEYEQLILSLASDKARLAKIKEKLVENAKTKPAFNTKIYTQNFEKLINSIIG